MQAHVPSSAYVAGAFMGDRKHTFIPGSTKGYSMCYTLLNIRKIS